MILVHLRNKIETFEYPFNKILSKLFFKLPMLPEQVEKTLRQLEILREQEIKREEMGEIYTKEKRSLAIPRDEGKFLYLLARSMKAKLIVEIGTSFGYSTIWLAAAVQSHGGTVISYDILPEKIEVASKYLSEAGLKGNVELVLGDAKTLLSQISEPVDIIFLDSDKADYPEFMELAIDKLRIGGILLSDNVLDCLEIHKDDPEVCEEITSYLIQHPKIMTVTLPFIPNGLEMTLKIAD